MKMIRNLIKILPILILGILVSCNDFEELNRDTSKSDVNQVMSEYFLNKSIYEAQQDPHIAERMFILTWKYAARFERGGGIIYGADNNEWISDYYGASYVGGCVNNASLAISVGEEQLKLNIHPENRNKITKNVIAMARIWRAYLLAEMASGFGPISVNREYVSEKDAFYFILKELKEGAESLDANVKMDDISKQDLFFGGKVEKWKKYANSLRMRYAMLLSVVDNAKAKEEFEDAVKDGESSFISSVDDVASVQEKDGWNPLAGVMSRPWNSQLISVTYNNMVVGLGGQTFAVPDSLKPYLKDPHAYLGLYLDKHFPLTTSDPCAGYFFDGIPSIIDPRATVLFNIPGYKDKINNQDIYFDQGSIKDSAKLLNPTDKTEMLKVRIKYSWSAWVAGVWDAKGALCSDLTGVVANYPRLSVKYRKSTNKRVWFADWESYFLLAEAKIYNWNLGKTGGTTEDFYNKGVRASFIYHGVDKNVEDYISSETYNRVGTSVKFTHTTEAKPYAIKAINPYTKTETTVNYQYPKNSIYKNGMVNNDELTKIITQKYLAQMPWLPLEAWSDHRRLGLPFMENPAAEVDFAPDRLPITVKTSKETRLEFYPKRYRYPASLQTSNAAGYAKAVEYLGGPDLAKTPLWWNMK